MAEDIHGEDPSSAPCTAGVAVHGDVAVGHEGREHHSVDMHDAGYVPCVVAVGQTAHRPGREDIVEVVVQPV
jgi:hypothetical protein